MVLKYVSRMLEYCCSFFFFTVLIIIIFLLDFHPPFSFSFFLNLYPEPQETRVPTRLHQQSVQNEDRGKKLRTRGKKKKVNLNKNQEEDEQEDEN